MSENKNEKKEKKEKVKYIDDGRTIADMSSVGGGKKRRNNTPLRPRASAKEQWQTYWNAVKMMFLPMLVVIGILCVTFLVAYLAFSL